MSKNQSVKVAIIDNSIDSGIYSPVDHWSKYLDVEWESFRAKKNQFPDLNDDYTHLILTGSEASILHREEWVFEEVEVVQEAMEKSLSILGSCYGHQLLALALVGPSHIRRCSQPEVGWIAVDINRENSLLGRKRQAYSFSIHFDEVVNLAEPFFILSSSAVSPIQAFQLKDRPVWGLQIHPEIDVATGRKLLRNLIQIDPRNRDCYLRALESTPRDSGLIHKIINAFFHYKR